jgi:hypothetical protein
MTAAKMSTDDTPKRASEQTRHTPVESARYPFDKEDDTAVKEMQAGTVRSGCAITRDGITRPYRTAFLLCPTSLRRR